MLYAAWQIGKRFFPTPRHLAVSSRVQGRDSRTWKGKRAPLPECEAAMVPVA
jgi:hypothetical protein